MKYQYAKLQNGSDIRGVAMATDPALPVNLDEEAAGRLALGFLFLLTVRTGKQPRELTVAIGRDSRLTGEALAAAAAQALTGNGARVLDAGLASTPAMFMATVFPEYRADGAIMLTASHMPMNRNGLKFFTAEGGLEKGDIADIINFAESDSILGRLYPGKGTYEQVALMDTYAAHLRGIICEGLGAAENDKPLAGLHIVVDAGNGAGGFYAEKVLAPLGADLSGSQFLEPDGRFPNHIPNPENKEAIESIRAAVMENRADLGLIFDTDVDRASAVDEQGREINKNGIVAMAAALIADQCPGTTVVTDSVTSLQLKAFLEGTLGLKHLRYRRGYRNVINKSIELNAEGVDSALAIETSGHAAYRENYFLDDGAYLATRIVIRAAELSREGKAISSVIADLAEPLEAAEYRLPIAGDDFAATGDAIISYLTELTRAGNLKGASLEEPNYEGVRINFTAPTVDGWLLLRKSLHEPIMPLNMEANAPGGLELMKRVLVPLLAGFPQLDISKLQ